MKNKKWTKIFSIAMALVLVAVCSVGATLAYLTAESDEVTNTFVSGQIIIKPTDFQLKEHEAVADAVKGVGFYTLNETETLTNTYTAMPGVNLPKDPFVRVKPAAEAYVFITVDNNMPATMTFAMDALWTPLEDNGQPVKLNGNPVYTLAAGKVPPATDPVEYNIIANKTVNVSGSLDPDTLDETSATLTFDGYLVQAASFATALDAWKGANFQ